MDWHLYAAMGRIIKERFPLRRRPTIKQREQEASS